MLRSTNIYYAAIVIDLVLRFFWSWTLIPESSSVDISNLGQYVAPFAAIAEIVRRSIWSVFRLENEHVHNTSGYRKVAHIPLHFDPPVNQTIESQSDNGGRMQILVEVGSFAAVVIAITVVAIVERKG